VTSEVLGPGEGRQYTARGSVMAFKALAETTGGDFSLMERTLPPGGRQPPPHRHTNCSEAYFVLDGLVTVTVEGVERAVGPEGFVLVPRGTAHTFGNTAGHPPGCWSSTPRPWTRTSRSCTNCGTPLSRPPGTTSGH
jgi:mannose-6-phosphate isomerase-like protein (cupin superfamily)